MGMADCSWDEESSSSQTDVIVSSSSLLSVWPSAWCWRDFLRLLWCVFWARSMVRLEGLSTAEQLFLLVVCCWLFFFWEDMNNNRFIVLRPSWTVRFIRLLGRSAVAAISEDEWSTSMAMVNDECGMDMLLLLLRCFCCYLCFREMFFQIQ